MRRLLPLVVALAGGCAQRDGLALLAVDPGVASSLSATAVTLHGRGFFGDAHTVVDDNSPTLVSISFGVEIGEFALDPATVERIDDKTLATVIPAGLTPGVYDVVVSDVGGATARARAAVTVVGPDTDLALSDDLSPPDLGSDDLAAADLSLPPDLAVAADLSVPPDLAVAADLSVPPDLAGAADLSVLPDLAVADLSTPDDLVGAADLRHVDLASAPVDLAGRDMNGVSFVNSVSVGGAFGATIYEAEGSTAPNGSGIALIATGGRLQMLSMVSASNGVTVGPVFVSSDGTELATSLHLPVNPAHGSADGTLTITLTFGTGALAQTGSFSIVTLDELTSTAAPPSTMGTPLLYSSVTLPASSTLTLPGPGPAFLLVMGAFSVNNVIVPTSVGGFPGCVTAPCSAANGPGRGASGSGGGGAGYATAAAGPGGGVAYGDPSAIGLPAGSGGGPGTAAGGAGGGVLRVLAGSIAITGSVHSDGDAGDAGPGLLLTSGGGGGSGGTLLLQSRGALALGKLTAKAGAGGSGAILGASGFPGAVGRIRADVALPQSIGGTVTPAVGYLGAMLSADFPTVHKAPTLPSVEIVCGQSTSVQILVDGANDGSATCPAGAAANRQPVPLTSALTADGKIHLVCARSLPSAAGPTPFYAAPFREDTNCRSLIVVQ